jgi:hypothetical protein
MKKYLLLFVLFISYFSVFAQKDSVKAKIDSVEVKIDKLTAVKDSIIAADTVRYWKKGGLTGLNFTQSSFTNWAAGGENAFSATALTSLFANYKKGKWSWDNNIDMAYGLLKPGTDKVRKNEDRIDFTSKLGRYAFYKHWYYTALINFKSQFDKGYNLPDDSNVVSHFLAPAYVIGAIGLEYKVEDNSFSVFISPLTSKTIIVNDQRLADAGAYGVDAAEYDSVAGVYVLSKYGNMVQSQFGGYIRIEVKKDIMKNVNLNTKLELFSDYLKNPQNIQVNWELLLSMKVNKFITTSISTNMIYDHNIPVPVKREINGVMVDGTGPRLQFKEVLAVGLAYKF